MAPDTALARLDTHAAQAGLIAPTLSFERRAWSPTAVLIRGTKGGLLQVNGGLLGALSAAPRPAAALDAVLAHELGHLDTDIKEGSQRRQFEHIARRTLPAATLVALSSAFAGLAWPTLGGLAAAALTLILIARLRRSARATEFAADAFSARLTGDAQAMPEALEAIAAYEGLCERLRTASVGLLRPHPPRILEAGDRLVPERLATTLEAALTAADERRAHLDRLFGLPLTAAELAEEVAWFEGRLPTSAPPSGPSWGSRLLATHPSAAERCRRLRENL